MLESGGVMRLIWVLGLSIFLSQASGCKSFYSRSADNQSELDGGITSAATLIKPPLRSRAVIKAMKVSLTRPTFLPASKGSSHTPRKILQAKIYGQILEVEGLPRVQLEGLLDDLMANSSTACGGVSCSRVFEIEPGKVGDFLDEAEKSVGADPRLAQPEQKSKRQVLLGSLAKQSLEYNLRLGDPGTWVKYVDSIATQGTKDDALRSSLVPIIRNFDEETRGEIIRRIHKHYEAAYKSKFKVSHGLAPKRAYDVILRYASGPEKYFRSVKTREDAMEAWANFFKSQKDSVFDRTDFGSYTPEDVVSVAKKMQEYLVSQGPKAKDVEILLKGSFPAGKANLRRKNPFDNVIDSIMTGSDTSYSDIDFLINADWEKPIKAIEPSIYQALVSKQAKDLVFGTKAKAFFQTHPDPFDLFAELDGSIMSPIGLRVNQNSLTLVVYNPLPVTELPTRDALSKMTAGEKKALYEKWASFYPL
jgi:hypothetical protein